MEKPTSVQTDQSGAESPPVAGDNRRDFTTKLLAGFIGALVMFVPLVSGILFLLDPLLRKKAGSTGDGFLFVTNLAAVPSDGTPARFRVIRDLVDAWNMYPRQPVGGIYLRKIGEQILAFNQICPHLGCAIDYREATQTYYCPCHASSFDLDGRKTNDIPPRDLDSLLVDVRNGNEVWVKFQKFQAATPEKIELS
ncbi:MAG: ubiquinol-cytochrome c reductase iron-sulfur subunit [Planctomycetaceae bacterium]